ncbi:MAG: methylmalonyl Co-A mutase-associated GTPase MeaB [Candidatus Magnetomorum sp.]|nr:methylmalonyl Co-A mutase-associated GTPase MeaB [Candidatus Magnetomorum sp.]
MINTPKKPEWAKDNCKAFASMIVPGVSGGHDGNLAYEKQSNLSDHSSKQVIRAKKLTPDDYVQGILNQDRAVLGRAITLVESHSARHRDMAQQILENLTPYTGQSIRVGITGVPGVGKSTFIEALGCFLLNKGFHPAVLAVDPSSSITGGSILGDKTRMEKLSRDRRCFIRPSPSSGTLGGVAQRTRETMMICEAAGFDVILVETVGVGQSETSVRSMVDFFLLLMLANAGDELQGIKKGIMEMADALLINKADGDNKLRAESARNEYERALHYLQPSIEGWKPHAHTCSSLTGEGIADIWAVIESFCSKTKQSGIFYKNRKKQALNWFHSLIEDRLKTLFFQHSAVKHHLPKIEKAIAEKNYSPSSAASQLMDHFLSR